MHVIKTVTDLKQYRNSLPSNQSLGFVPTLGALHSGHASLVSMSLTENDQTIVSIFVNPTQFGPNEDFSAYPRPLNEDIELLQKMGVQAVFIPEVPDIYPHQQNLISFRLGDAGAILDAKSRPGHMEGVLQVVSILFHIISPNRAYFGLKDYQQYILIRQLVSTFHFPLEIIPCPIVREEDGLALSSRNRYLSEEERKQAIFLYQALTHIKKFFPHFHSMAEITQWVHQEKEAYPMVDIDYFYILEAQSLHVPSEIHQPNLRAFLAAFVGNTRLIDNMQIT